MVAALFDEEEQQFVAVGQDAVFDGATFTGHAGFAGFAGATFTDDARFNRTTFTRYASFGEATFTDDASFTGATFTGAAGFDGATFTGHVWFDEAAGLERTKLDGVRVASTAVDVRRVWPPCWRMEAGADGWQTLRLAEPEQVAEPGPAEETED